MEKERMTAWVSGRVQGVGFRWFTKWRAQSLGLTGTATNLDDGRVEVIAEGPRAELDKLFRLLADPDVDGRPGRVDFVTAQFGQARGVEGFRER